MRTILVPQAEEHRTLNGLPPKARCSQASLPLCLVLGESGYTHQERVILSYKDPCGNRTLPLSNQQIAFAKSGDKPLAIAEKIIARRAKRALHHEETWSSIVAFLAHAVKHTLSPPYIGTDQSSV